MGSTRAKTGPLPEWRPLLRSLTAVDTGQLDVLTGLRIGILTIIPTIMGLATGQAYDGLIASLGAFNLSMPEAKGKPRRQLLPLLAALAIVNPSAFALGTLVGTGGALAAPLFGLGFFSAAYLAIRTDSPIIGSTACVLFSLGFGLPGGGSAFSAWARFWLLFAGGLLGLVGATLSAAVRPGLENSEGVRSDDWMVGANRTAPGARQSALPQVNPPMPATTNLSLRANALQFSVAFGLAGAVALVIVQNWDLTRDYWVLVTLAVLLLRSDVSTAPTFIGLRVIGTIVGALVGLAVTALVVNSWLLLAFVFAFCTMYYAMRGLNYGLGTILLTPFVLVLINVPSPGNSLLAEARILDTLIAAGLSLVMISVLSVTFKRADDLKPG